MKKSTLSAGAIVAVIIIALVIWYSRSGSGTPTPADQVNTNVVAVTETTKVSSKTSEYKNSELGFSVQYPTPWEVDKTNTGVTFIMPIDQAQVSTVAKLQADINVVPKCAFPPVVTVKDRGTLKAGANTFNMISMSNTVQSRGYFDRMYSLSANGVCYMFHFASITLAPSSKNLTGSSATQAQNNNKAIIDTADAAFTDMAKSFALVVLPTGEDETKAAPTK